MVRYHRSKLNYLGKNTPRRKRGMNYFVTKARYYSRNKVNKPYDFSLYEYERNVPDNKRVM